MVDFSEVKVEKLSKLHKTDLFDCGDDDINEFLKEDALGYQEKKLATTRIFIYNEEIIGFFCCSADAIRLNTEEKKNDCLIEKRIPEVPAMKIGRLGRNIKFKGQNIGNKMLKWAIGYILELSKDTGIRYVTVDAYLHLIKWYEKTGFIRNLHEQYDEKIHISMRYDLYNPPENES